MRKPKKSGLITTLGLAGAALLGGTGCAPTTQTNTPSPQYPEGQVTGTTFGELTQDSSNYKIEVNRLHGRDIYIRERPDLKDREGVLPFEMFYAEDTYEQFNGAGEVNLTPTKTYVPCQVYVTTEDRRGQVPATRVPLRATPSETTGGVRLIRTPSSQLQRLSESQTGDFSALRTEKNDDLLIATTQIQGRNHFYPLIPEEDRTRHDYETQGRVLRDDIMYFNLIPISKNPEIPRYEAAPNGTITLLGHEGIFLPREECLFAEPEEISAGEAERIR